MRNPKPYRKRTRLLAALFAVALLTGVIAGCGAKDSAQPPQSEAAGPGGENPASIPEAASLPESATESALPQPLDEVPEGMYNAIPLPEEMRAMWIAYLELDEMDFSSEEALRAEAAEMFDNCVSVGMNTVILSVRPFSDAIYPSEIFPWSHYVTGTQGQDPGYDPLQVLIEEAHARGLRFEAAINPYRVQIVVDEGLRPPRVSDDNPAIAYPDRVVNYNNEYWYDPGLPEVRDMVIDGVVELVENYDVDGIHFDDYFYPTTEGSFDEATFAAYGEGETLADWRRENVNKLIRGVYAAVKAANPSVIFGIAPQGNYENNYNQQYSDVRLWLAGEGYADYVMPQLYWGFGWQNGDQNWAAFPNVTRQWANYERTDSVKLYAALGAYRIGAGDGSAGDQSEWYSGRAIADQVLHLKDIDGYSGYMIFRYEFLFWGDDALRTAEAAALAEANGA